jgi:hypothetical protein
LAGGRLSTCQIILGVRSAADRGGEPKRLPDRDLSIGRGDRDAGRGSGCGGDARDSQAMGSVTPAGVTVAAQSVADPSVPATATVTLLARPPAGQTFFVAPSGKDANPGTRAAP